MPHSELHALNCPHMSNKSGIISSFSAVSQVQVHFTLNTVSNNQIDTELTSPYIQLGGNYIAELVCPSIYLGRICVHCLFIGKFSTQTQSARRR